MSEHHTHEHHDHSSHAHIPQDKKILALSFAIITSFMVVEFVGGYWFNSLALMADAGHMANDSLSLFLALLALFLSAQKQRYIALLNSGSLIERVAYEVAEQLQQRFGISWLRLKLSKPKAVAQANNVGIIVERGELK